MESIQLAQQRFGNKTKFVFKKEGFDYTISDRSGVRTVYISYLSINTESQNVFVEKNEWFRNAGYIWVIIGVAFYFIGNPSGFLFAILGIGCLGIYYFTQVKYIMFGSDNGNIYIINNKDSQSIINRINEGRKKMILLKFGEIDYTRSFELEKEKYNYFLNNEFIDLPEFNKYLETMEATKDQFTGN